ncbi:hypothetical protein TMatcc_001267 [Talaromyces marneffei ATCC 18224]
MPDWRHVQLNWHINSNGSGPRKPINRTISRRRNTESGAISMDLRMGRVSLRRSCYYFLISTLWTVRSGALAIRRLVRISKESQ